MKRLLAVLLVSVLASVAEAAPINLSTFAPPNHPACTLFGAAASFNGGTPTAGTPILVTVGDTITISLQVTNGVFSGPNILVINGTSFNYSVTLPIQVTTSAAGHWDIEFVTPGCDGSVLTIISH